MSFSNKCGLIGYFIFVCSSGFFVFLGISAFFGFLKMAVASQNAVSLGAGGGGRATVESSEALALNPATLLFTRGYNFSSHYQLSEAKSGVNATTSLHRWSVNLTDNQRGNLFPAGVRYQFSQFKKTGALAFEQELQQIWVGVGYSVSQRLGFGLSGVYFSESTPNWVPDRSQSYGVTLGSLYSFSPNFGLAISAQEIPVTHNQRGLMQNQLGIGLSYIYSYFLRTRIDLESGQNQNFDQPWVSMGFESLLSTWFAFRGGGKWQPDTSDWRSTLGFGLIGPRLSLNYAYIPSSRETDGALHALDLILPLW